MGITDTVASISLSSHMSTYKMYLFKLFQCLFQRPRSPEQSFQVSYKSKTALGQSIGKLRVPAQIPINSYMFMVAAKAIYRKTFKRRRLRSIQCIGACRSQLWGVEAGEGVLTAGGVALKVLRSTKGG